MKALLWSLWLLAVGAVIVVGGVLGSWLAVGLWWP